MYYERGEQSFDYEASQGKVFGLYHSELEFYIEKGWKLPFRAGILHQKRMFPYKFAYTVSRCFGLKGISYGEFGDIYECWNKS